MDTSPPRDAAEAESATLSLDAGADEALEWLETRCVRPREPVAE